jgi:thioredoxin-related protein
MKIDKHKILGWLVAVCLLAAGWGGVSAWGSEGVRWYDYEEGRSLMQSEGKKGFISFYADWCKYCKVMEAQTFGNAAVIAYLNRNFIAMKVNSDKETQRAVDFGVRGLPSTWFLTADGKRISNRPGLIPPKDMLNILKFIHTESYEKMSFDDFLSRQN